MQLQRLFFSFQQEKHQTTEALGMVGGCLILDSGEADPSFMYRCQDRYFAYTSLLGIRSLFLVMNHAHAKLYSKHIQEMRGHIATIRRYTGLKLLESVEEPAYLHYDAAENNVALDRHFLAQISRHGLPRLSTIYANQISPSGAGLVEQLHKQLSTHLATPNLDVQAYQNAAAMASRFHDKLAYFDLLKHTAARQTIRHTPTTVIDEQTLSRLDSWDKMSRLASELGVLDDTSIAKLFIKSTLDSGGNTSAVLSAHDYPHQYRRLQHAIREGVHMCDTHRDVAHKNLTNVIADSSTLGRVPAATASVEKWLNAWINIRRGKSVHYLLQRYVARSPQTDETLPSGIGISLFIDNDKNTHLIAIAGQVYSDAEHKHHLGSLLSTKLENNVLSICDINSLKTLCKLFADEGYRGPISFDAVLNEQRNYEFIYDCNPRLTAVMPSLAVKTALSQLGHTIESIMNLDYRGRFQFPDLDSVLQKLKWDDLLLTHDRSRGLLILPNIARQYGYDVLFINLRHDEAIEAMQHPIFSDNFDIDKGRIETLYV